MATIANKVPDTKTLPTILIGADPEIFVKKNGINISAHELLPGTKKNPFKVQDGAVQIDGTALEFNIDPVSDAKSFVHHIQSVMSQMSDMVKSKDPSVEFDITPAVLYDKSIFAQIPESAKELGCEPDYNAWTGLENARPDSTALKGYETLRTGSGHVHIGWTNGADKNSPTHMADCRILAKCLDTVLGSASLFWDKDTTRKKLYGNWGAFRPKPYGMEYRSLSNSWLSDPSLVEFVFNASQRVAQILMLYGKVPWNSILGNGWDKSTVPNHIHKNHFDYYFSPMFGDLPKKFGTSIGYASSSDRVYYASRFSNGTPDGLKAFKSLQAAT